MRRLFSLLAAACLASSPVTGQSFDEAVHSNTWLATDLCLQVMLDRVSPRAVFGAAGFVLRSEHRGVNEYGVDRGFSHYFDAPADTVKAEVPDLDQMSGLCSVTTTHLVEPLFAQVIQQAVLNRYPQAEIRDANQIVLRRFPGDLPLIISIRTIGTNHRYEIPGTVEVSMSFPG